jgi:hypothetical protein
VTGSRLCEYEKWPRSTRKPPVYVLFMLAEIYETSVLCPLDLADHESLPRLARHHSAAARWERAGISRR